MFENKFQKLLYLFLGILVVLGWMHQPIYTDEATYFRTVAFIYENDWRRPAIYQACNDYPWVNVSYLFYPAAYLFSLLSDLGSYSALRHFCILLFASSSAYFFYIISEKTGQRNLSLVLILSMYSGVLVSTVSIFRPELFIIVTLIFFSLSVISIKLKEGVSVFYASIGVLIYSLALLMHAKSLLLFPVIIFALLYLFNFKNFIALILIALVFGLTHNAYVIDTMQFINCPANLDFDKLIKSWSVNPTLLISQPLEFFRSIGEILANTDFNDVFWKMYYRQDYDFKMLPSLKAAPFAGMSNFSHTILISFVVLILIVKEKLLVVDFLSKSFGREERLYSIYSILMLMLIVIYVSINRVGAWYDKGLWLSLIMILAALPVKSFEVDKSIIRVLLPIAFLTFFASSYINLFYMRPILKINYGSEGVILSQHNSDLNDFRLVMSECGISGEEPGLVSDDEPLFLIRKSLGSTSLHYAIQPLGVPKAIEWILNRKAPAIIGRCDPLEVIIRNSGESNKFIKFKVNKACCYRVL